MQIGVEQSEYWPLWIELGGERYELEYHVREATEGELRGSCVSHVWSVSAKLNGYTYQFSGTTPIHAVTKLAEEMTNRLGLATKRFTLDLPVSWTDLERQILTRRSWSQ